MKAPLSLKTSLLLLVAWIAVCVESQDCRKYVYAPKCRGVSAKRSNDFLDYARKLRVAPEESASLEGPVSEENSSLENDLKLLNGRLMRYIVSTVSRQNGRANRLRPLADE